MGGLLPKPVTTKEIQDGKSQTGHYAFGVSSMQGWRPAMEDAHMAIPDFEPERELALFGVFDGHGGAAVAKVAAERFPETLRALPAFKQGRYSEALYESFLKLDSFLDSPAGREKVKEATPPPLDSEMEEEELLRLLESGELDADDLEGLEEEVEEEAAEEDEAEEPASGSSSDWANAEGPDGMGCTAVVALVCGGSKPEVFCANAGDSRCVLARGGRAQNLSRDHKPELKRERRRITQAGGFVSADGRVDGNLNLSRSLGDFAYKKDASRKATEQKISAEAEVKRRGLGPADQYLAIGCDGIFEKFSSQELLNFLLPHLRRRRRSQAPLSKACSAFLDANIAKSPQKEQGLGCDNMTLLVVELQPSQRSQMRQLWTFPHGSAVHRAGGKVTMTPSSRRRVVMQLQNVKRSSRAKVKNAGRSKMRSS